MTRFVNSGSSLIIFWTDTIGQFRIEFINLNRFLFNYGRFFYPFVDESHWNLLNQIFKTQKCRPRWATVAWQKNVSVRKKERVKKKYIYKKGGRKEKRGGGGISGGIAGPPHVMQNVTEGHWKWTCRTANESSRWASSKTTHNTRLPVGEKLIKVR